MVRIPFSRDKARIVIPVVVGSSPISHPTEYAGKSKGYMLRLVTLFLHFPTVFLIFQRSELSYGSATARGRIGQCLQSVSDPTIDNLFRWRHHYETRLAVQLHAQRSAEKPRRAHTRA